MSTIVVIGSKGMLGTELMSFLSQGKNRVIGLGRSDIDISRATCVDLLIKLNPKIILNCAAYTNVDKAETERELCYATNVTGVKHIVEACRRTNCRLIHLSTDYVFDGTKKEYREDDAKNPLNYYGITKAQGEDIILSSLDDFIIFRTSWLFGKHGKNFVRTILRLSQEKSMLKVVNDQIGSPTYAQDLAAFICTHLDLPSSIYHVTNQGTCSWYDFARDIFKITGITTPLYPCTTKEYPLPARRPSHSVLKNTKLPLLRPYQDALKDYLREGNYGNTKN